jgi:hypothetical protein
VTAGETAPVTGLQAEGPVGDLLEALGVTLEGNLHRAFFDTPGATLRGLLADARRRGKLLAVVRSLLASAEVDLGPAQTVDGRDWLPVIGPQRGSSAGGGHLDLCVVLDSGSSGAHGPAVVGLGIRYRHTAGADGPRLAVRAVVPVVTVPAVGAATLALGTPSGALHVDARLEPGTDGGALDVDALRAVLTVPTDGTEQPRVVVSALGLRLGDAAPSDVVLDSSAPLADSAMNVAATLLRSLAESADPRLAALLRLVGLGADPAVPPLPLDRLTT